MPGEWTLDIAIDEVRELWSNEALDAAIFAGEAAVAEFGEDAELLDLLGDMLYTRHINAWLGAWFEWMESGADDGERPEQLTEDAKGSLQCYERARDADPDWAEPWVSIGYWHDCFEQFEVAETCFRRAIELEASMWSYYGLARVLAQQGRTGEALQLIDGCSFKEDAQIEKMREEVVGGEWDRDWLDTDDDELDR